MELRYKLIALGLIIAALGAFHYTDRYAAVHKAEQATESRLNASYQAELNKAADKAKRLEQQMQQDANTLKESKDAQIKIVNEQLSVAISELRKRPKRPSDYSPTTSVTSSCTARELYQEDAGFLTREAARADSILIERDYYYEQYERARQQLAK